MTKEAEQFITPLTLSSLAEEKAYTSMFHDGHEMPHIKLAQTADLILIAPATANIIGKIACGIADDLLTCIVLATAAPIVIVRAMNVEMYKNKIVQENCNRLKELGFHFVDLVLAKYILNHSKIDQSAKQYLIVLCRQSSRHSRLLFYIPCQYFGIS